MIFEQRDIIFIIFDQKDIVLKENNFTIFDQKDIILKGAFNNQEFVIKLDIDIILEQPPEIGYGYLYGYKYGEGL